MFTLPEEPASSNCSTKATKARGRAEQDLAPAGVREMLRRNPAQVSNTVYLDRWKAPTRADMAFQERLYNPHANELRARSRCCRRLRWRFTARSRSRGRRALRRGRASNSTDRKRSRSRRDYFSTPRRTRGGVAGGSGDGIAGDGALALARLQAGRAPSPPHGGPGGKMVKLASKVFRILLAQLNGRHRRSPSDIRPKLASGPP